MLQDTKWERQLSVSWPTNCTLPYHKIHSESNSVVVLPVMWYHTYCLKIMLVIFQKWWHEIAHAVSFFSQNAQFFLLLKKKKKRKKHREKTCTLPKPNELVRKNQLCDKLINWDIVLTSELLPTVSLHREKDTDSACLHVRSLASYLWMLHPGIYWTDLWGILLLSRNCHAGQHQNEGIHRFWIAHGDSEVMQPPLQ